jgi:glutamate dehydrogenase (NADP+)
MVPSLRDSWTFEYTDSGLRRMMKKNHQSCYEAAEEYGLLGNYIVGVNIHSFLKVARAMVAMGLI